MSDTILKDESKTCYSFDNIRTQGWLDGHIGGLNQAVEWIKERAVILFREGKDDSAINLRKLAEDMNRTLRPIMEQRSNQHEREFPAIIEIE